VDARSDLYSLGAVGYYLLTGENVFSGKTLIEICGHHLHSKPVPPSERLSGPVHEGLSQLILRCLEKEPDARPASAESLVDELRALDLIRGWDAKHARAWWRSHGNAIDAHKSEPALAVPLRTIAVDLADRFDRLDKYLARHVDA
jgi:serine/threonine-protein kinase